MQNACDVANGRRDPPYPLQTYSTFPPPGCQLQARWEQRDPGCPRPSTAPAGGEATTRQGEGGVAQPESARESAPAHDGDEGNVIELVVNPGDTAATSASVPSSGSTGEDGGGGGGGGGAEGAAVGGDGGAGEDGPSTAKSEEYLLESAGSMVEGLGGDLEGGEVSRKSVRAVLRPRVCSRAFLRCCYGGPCLAIVGLGCVCRVPRSKGRIGTGFKLNIVFIFRAHLIFFEYATDYLVSSKRLGVRRPCHMKTNAMPGRPVSKPKTFAHFDAHNIDFWRPTDTLFFSPP